MGEAPRPSYSSDEMRGARDLGTTLMKLDRVTSNPNRMNGQPCIRDLRLTVRRVIELLATYPDREELHQEFPELEDEDIRQALIFASS